MKPSLVPPRWGTPRTSRPTLGGRVGKVATVLGLPPMPWQQHVFDVGFELDGNGAPAYREIVVTVMRQSGKTTILLAVKVDRGYYLMEWGGLPQKILYSAQTGKDGKEKLLDDEWPIIARSHFSAAFKNPTRAAGSEALNFVNGSVVKNMASSEEAGHGKTLDLGIIDEAFADVDDHREQAMIPAQATKPLAQLWIASTMGTDASAYLNRKVERGRALAEAGRTDDVAYFEWSIPDTEDIDSPAVWARYMPAYGHTIGERAVRHARTTMDDSEFRRAWCNQRTSAVERVIPIAEWMKACSTEVALTGKATYSLECNPERTWSAIAVADRAGHIELAVHDSGTSWAVEHVVRKCKERRAKVAINPSGPAGAFIDEIERQRVKVIKVAGNDLTASCGAIFDAIMNTEAPFIRSSDALSAACASLMRRYSGDAWVWDRKGVSDISPFFAATLARYAAMKGGGGGVFAY